MAEGRVSRLNAFCVKDANDAALLAEIARTGFYRPVAVSSEAAQEQRIPIKARSHLVRQRRATENAIRGFPASLGLRFSKGSGKLAGRVRAALEERLDLMTTPGVGPITALAYAATIDDAARANLIATRGGPPLMRPILIP